MKDKAWLGPGLCIARAFGDLNAAKCGVVATPEVVVHNIQPEDEYLILASDGVWEFIDEKEAVTLIHKLRTAGKDASEATRLLIANAALAWRREEGNYRDDITAVVVYMSEALKRLDAPTGS